MSLIIQHKGYTITQAYNNHIWISKDGKNIGHASCSKPHTEESLRRVADSMIEIFQLSEPEVKQKTTPKIPSVQGVETFRKLTPVGTRIQMVRMDDPYHPVPAGTRGSVRYIDDAGQYHIDWDNGQTLACIPGVDQFRLLTAEELQFETELFAFCQDMLDELRQPGDHASFPISEENGDLVVKMDQLPSGNPYYTVEIVHASEHPQEKKFLEDRVPCVANTLYKVCLRVLSRYHI